MSGPEGRAGAVRWAIPAAAVLPALCCAVSAGQGLRPAWAAFSRGGVGAAGARPGPEGDPERTEDDQDTGDFPAGTDEDALDTDELDTDRVTRTEALPAFASMPACFGVVACPSSGSLPGCRLDGGA